MTLHATASAHRQHGFLSYWIMWASTHKCFTGGATLPIHDRVVAREGDTLASFMYERLKSGNIIGGCYKVEQLWETGPINLVAT